MSQAAIKPSRPSLSLSQSAGVRKGSRSNTPLTSEKTDSRSSTPKVDTIEESPGKAKPKSRASPRVSTDEKAAQKQDNTNGTHENGSNGNSDSVKKDVEKVNEEKKIESPKSAKEEKKVATPKKETPKKETPKKETPKTSNVSDDEMEALVIEPEQPETPKTGRQTTAPVGRVLTPLQGPPSGRAKPFQKPTVQERLQSTNVNLSTVSEQSTEATSPMDSPYNIPDKIVGRRTTRPIKDIQITYREKLNESSSSLNATVGSTIHNDSINTPYVAKVGGMKRQLDDIEGLVDSPSKRMHIDFSGFVGYVTTPITMLKNRFTRVGLNASTPRKLEVDEESIADISGTEAVSAAEEAIEAENTEDPKATKAEEEKEVADEAEEKPANRSFCTIM